MKYIEAILALTLLVIISGCAKNDDIKSEQQDPVVEKPKTQNKIEMPKVKYPAAIIFEGGKGDPWFDQDNSKHTPMWRLYVCLGKTTQPVNAEVVLDFDQLGTPYEQIGQDSSTHEKLYTERLHQVVLDYVYTTELSDDPVNNYGFAYGNASIEMKSKQSWELIYLAPNQSHNHQEWNDLRFFNFNITPGSLAYFGMTNLESNGEPRYISSTLTRFKYSERDNQANVIEVCEKADKPYVLQTEKDITPSIK